MKQKCLGVTLAVVCLYAIAVSIVTFVPPASSRDNKPALMGDNDVVALLDIKSTQTLEIRDGSYTLEYWQYSYYSYATSSVEGAELVEAPDCFSSTALLNVASTAFIVMDPWVDMPGDYYTSRIISNIEEKLLPLVEAAEKTGHPVYILTNDPVESDYSAEIHPLLQKMVDEGRATLLYHCDINTESMADYFVDCGIDTLVYMGYSSSMCVILRPLGIISLWKTGKFRILFVPDASLSTNTGNDELDLTVHESTAFLLAANHVAGLVDYDYYYSGLSKAAKTMARAAA